MGRKATKELKVVRGKIVAARCRILVYGAGGHQDFDLPKEHWAYFVNSWSEWLQGAQVYLYKSGSRLHGSFMEATSRSARGICMVTVNGGVGALAGERGSQNEIKMTWSRKVAGAPDEPLVDFYLFLTSESYSKKWWSANGEAYRAARKEGEPFLPPAATTAPAATATATAAPEELEDEPEFMPGGGGVMISDDDGSLVTVEEYNRRHSVG